MRSQGAWLKNIATKISYYIHNIHYIYLSKSIYRSKEIIQSSYSLFILIIIEEIIY